jgi:glycosyltransferase involved in cell wall biosynthesis
VKLGFDASSLYPDGKGLSRVQAELLRAIADLGTVPDLTVFAPANAPLPGAADWRHVVIPPGSMLTWEQIGLPRASRRAGLDVVFTTSERAALWGPPQVVMVIEHPRHRTKRAREVGVPLRQRLVDMSILALFPLSMRRAASVVTTSRATANDIASLVPSRVVPLAVPERFSPGGTAGGYLLHVGSDDPRDNSEVVLEALGELARQGERPELVMAGGIRSRLQPLRELADRLGVADQVRWIGYQRDDTLVDLYRGAVAYVDPSLYEGFGLQALEALACGTPVISSDRTSLPEVIGDAGILLDPNDVQGFAEAMRRLLREPELRNELSERALRQAKRFSWEQTARAILAACAELAGSRRGAAAATS